MTANHERSIHPLIAFGVLGIWCAVIISGGILRFDRPWGVLALATGLLSAGAVGLGVWRRSWLGAGLGVMAIAGGAVLAGGALLADPIVAALGVVGLLVVAAAGAITLERSRNSRSVRGETLLVQILENSTLSESARRVLFRDRDLKLLRRAIEEDITRGEYDAAWTVCDDLAEVYGRRAEAEEYRSRIAQIRHEHYESQIHAALESFEALLSDRDWAAVHEEAARLGRLYPDSHLVANLDHRIMAARDDHKRELEAFFMEAAQRDDVEEAMSLLKQLDRYLDREEAGRLAEIAQGVVVKHRENLGARFKLAVNDRRWSEAAEIGDLIMAEFPNTKMAAEVRSLTDILRSRAEGAEARSQESGVRS